jgi:hypothetical protein
VTKHLYEMDDGSGDEAVFDLPEGYTPPQMIIARDASGAAITFDLNIVNYDPNNFVANLPQIYICEFCDETAKNRGVWRNPETFMDEYVLVCDTHVTKCIPGTVEEGTEE